jgi:suppressor for copper-sensitivity B
MLKVSMPRIAAVYLMLLGVLAAGALGLPLRAEAAAGPWAGNDQAAVRLISASDSAGEGGSLRLGLEFRLEEGWKTYWRSPGDAGYPPSLEWDDPANLAAVEMAWPVPHRFSLFGLETFGYGEQVVFPITATPARAGEALSLSAKVSYLVCAEICIPHEGQVSLDLPAGPPTPAAEGFLIDRFRAQVPDNGARSGLSLERAVLTGDGEAQALEVSLSSSVPLEAPDVLVENGGGYRFGRPTVRLDTDRAGALLRLPVTRAPGADGALAGREVTLTLVDGERGAEARVRLEAGPALVGRDAADGAGTGLLLILGLAVLGGLVLNLMPCVLPVLSIKLLSVVGHGGRETRGVRLAFIASAAGILVSFLLLAGGAIALKGAGLAVGWGIQFQQPVFLALMALVVTLFACNLFGFFEISLPQSLSGVALRGSGDGGHHSLAGHFATGAFATLLATPCSAPFLGTAVGFALSRGAGEILAIFVAIGLGLALPYLVVALFPALATRLPRPGSWMVTLRRVLGVALVATAVWLLSVLAVQVGMETAVLAGLLLLALGTVIYVARRMSLPSRLVPMAVALLALSSIGLAAIPLPPPATPAAAAGALAGADWQRLDRTAIDRMVAAGEVIFVDITAEWCITCQVNKTLVLDRAPVVDILSGGDVVLMRGDWTRPDDSIATYLASNGRYGIPFNAVYGPAAPEGIVLPELLTERAVVEALEKAAGGRALAAR